VLMTAGESITPQSIHDVIMTAPVSPEELASDQWAEQPCNQALRAAHYAAKTPIEEHDFKLARDYLTREWVSMSDRTRASILVGTIGTLTAMNTGLCRELFANYSNITPKDAIEGRKIIIIDLPPDDLGDTGRIGNIGWKFHYQREVLRRQVTGDSPIAVIWGDEFSEWLSPFDASYVSRCRSYRGAMVAISQSLESFREVLPGDKGRSSVEALLSNFGHKLFFALGDSTTANWAAELVGKEMKLFSGGGTQHSTYSPFAIDDPHYSTSYNEQYAHIIEPSRFLNGFRTGGPLHDFTVDALLLRSGEAFSNGLPIVPVAFDQRA
jgi:type IV secretory pathway TraG/TraD family ATPase VirD4